MRGSFALLVTLGAGAAACGPRVSPPPPRPPPALGEAAPIRRIEPGVLRGLMIAGALRVEPDDALAAAIAAHGDRPLLAIVTVCLDADGNATGVLRRPSEVLAFDQAALAVVKTWRFRPYVDGRAAAPACSFAVFRHGRSVTPDGEPPPADWYDGLPAPEIELPPAQYIEGSVQPNHIGRRATPGVALARVCRQRGSRAAPHLWWLQSSGDPVADRELFDRRLTMPVGEAADGSSLCAVRSLIVAGPGQPEMDTTRMANVTTEYLGAQRLSGDKVILPSDDLKIAIYESGLREFEAVVRVCIADTGVPVSVAVVQSSGWTGYDMDLANTIARWRYRPFTADGMEMPACGIVKFSYRQS